MSQEPPNDRNAERKAVRMPATCRSSTGLRDEGWLEDISAVGCCFVAKSMCFKLGSQVIVRPGGLEGITGTVRWVAANRCGIQFSSPLYGAVLDHLCRQFGASESHVLAAPPAAPQYQPSYPQSYDQRYRPQGQGHPLRRRMF